MVDRLKSRPASVALLIVSIVLIVGVLTFAGPCVHDDGSSAACHTAQLAIAILGVFGAASALASVLASSGKVTGALSLLAACCGAAVAAAPGGMFGLCMMQTMRCWQVMRPFALVCGAGMLIIGIAAATSSFSRGRRHAS